MGTAAIIVNARSASVACLTTLLAALPLFPSPASAQRTNPFEPVASGNGGIAATNTECASAEAIAGEDTFLFDNRGPLGDAEWLLTDCSNSIAPYTYGDVWYCWTSPCSGSVTVSTCGMTAVDTIMGVYDGCTCPPTAESGLACDDDGCGYQSQVVFQAVAGSDYLVRLGTNAWIDLAGGPGSFSITCGDVTELVCSQPETHCQPSAHGNALTSDGRAHTVADNFTLATPGDVSQVCWWGTYFDGIHDCRGLSDDSFEIRYYDDNDGAPGALIGGPFRQADGSLTVAGPVPTVHRPAERLLEYEYHGTHVAVALAACSGPASEQPLEKPADAQRDARERSIVWV